MVWYYWLQEVWAWDAFPAAATAAGSTSKKFRKFKVYLIWIAIFSFNFVNLCSGNEKPIANTFWRTVSVPFSFPSSRQAVFQFCYDNPTCAPNTWPGTCATGSQQSPINFDGKFTTVKILPPTYRHFYETSPAAETSNFLIQNTGRTIEVMFPPGSEPNLRGPSIGLPGDYRFVQMHLHWGQTDKDGTEHRVLGLGYALEIHLVHYSTVYANYAQATVAPNDPNAIAILAILFEIEGLGLVDNLALKPITDSIPLIRTYNNGVDVDVYQFLNLKDLFPPISNFYRYEGSLTTPDCHENRVWTVFKEPNRISKKQMELIRSMFETNNVDLLLANHRPLQARNGRPIAFYFVTTSIADWIVRVFTSFYTAIRGFLTSPFGLLGQRMGLLLNLIGSRVTMNNNGFISIVVKELV